MQSFAAGWRPPEGFNRYVWDWEGLLGGRDFRCTVDELEAEMPSLLQEPFKVTLDQVRSSVDCTEVITFFDRVGCHYEYREHQHTTTICKQSFVDDDIWYILW